jgi:hypothetical protein
MSVPEEGQRIFLYFHRQHCAGDTQNSRGIGTIIVILDYFRALVNKICQEFVVK